MASPNEITVSSGSTSSQMVYPKDLERNPYYTSLNFLKYKRDAPGDKLTFLRQGSIYLPIPDQLREEYNINNSERGTGLFHGSVGQTMSEVAKVGDDFVKSLQGTWEAGKGDIGKIRDTALKAGQYLQTISPSFIQDRTALGAILTQQTGMVQNPHMTMLFDGVALRQHRFSWTFSPRSEEESKILLNICNTIKSHAHPTYNALVGKFALDFPNQVYMNFRGTDYQFPVKRSVINGISVDNTAGGKPVWYAGGAPVQIGLQISLTEVEILTREDFTGNTSYTADGSYSSGIAEVK